MDSKEPRIPRHIAIIMDGNGRWAVQRGKSRLAGHQAGSETVGYVLKYCLDAGIQYVTLFAFSMENWSRPRAEINGLMSLLDSFINEYKNYTDDVLKHQVRLRVIGRREDLTDNMRSMLVRVENDTAEFDRQVIVALSYSGRDELVHAMRSIAREVKAGMLAPEDIDEALITSHMYAPDVPEPDLIIRTGGELRISNFLLWQSAYAELYVTPVLWPDFNEAEFNEALAAYAKRERRFGRVNSVQYR
jgi:undecaprenyl diphosphate synthase